MNDDRWDEGANPSGLPAGTSRAITAIAIAALIALALLITSNVLLWQIADDDEPTRTAAGLGAKGGGGGVGDSGQPLLPPPTTGTSNRATADELDRLSRRLSTQFDSLRGTLSPLIGSASTASAIPPGLADVSNSLDALTLEAELFGGSVSSLDDVSASIGGLGNVRRELASIDATIGAVEANTGTLVGTGDGTIRQLKRSQRELKETNQGVSDTNTGIGTTNSSLVTTNDLLTDVTETLIEMDGTMDSVDRRMANVDQSTSQMSGKLSETNAQLDETNIQLERVNNNLVLMIRVYCQSQTPPPPACALVGP